MDQFNPNNELTKLYQVGNQPPNGEPPSQPPPESNFYREFVKFAIFVGVVVIPVFISYAYLAKSLQGFVAEFIVPYNPSGSDTRGHTISLALAQGVVVSGLFLIFANVYFASRAIGQRWRQRGQRTSGASGHAQVETADHEKEVAELRQRLQTNMTYLRIIHNQMYRDETPRLAYAYEDNRYYVDEGGDLIVDKHVTVRADDRDVQFWKLVADGDEHSAPAPTVDDINLSVVALDEKTNLLPLTIVDKDKHKEIAVYFLPLLEPGESRSFRVHYRWNGSFLGLVKLGEIPFTWTNRSSVSDGRGKFHCQWIFHEAYGDVDCEVTGKRPPGLDLDRADDRFRTIWHYGGDDVPTSNILYELTFRISDDARHNLLSKSLSR
jgi:uncharacterized membrane protein (DUF485 family)